MKIAWLKHVLQTQSLYSFGALQTLVEENQYEILRELYPELKGLEFVKKTKEYMDIKGKRNLLNKLKFDYYKYENK